MFRSAENLRLAADMRALQRVAAPWRKARSTWFDGTPESIEGRLAATERVLTYARGGVTQAHIALEREASIARAELKEAAHRLMVDFLDDGARAFKGSKRVAKSYPEPGWEIEHDRRMDFMDWAGLPFALSDEDEDYDEYKHLTSDNPKSKAHLYEHPEVYEQDPDWRVKKGSKRVAEDWKVGDDPYQSDDPLIDDDPYFQDEGFRADADDLNDWMRKHREMHGPEDDDPAHYSSLRNADKDMALSADSGTQGWPSSAPTATAGGHASTTLPGAIGQMALNGSTMTGQEPPAAFNAGPGVTPKTSAASLPDFDDSLLFGD